MDADHLQPLYQHDLQPRRRFPAQHPWSSDGLLENARDILRHFAQTEKAVSGFNEQQIAEEKLKAELILAEDAWRELIDRAEGHGYFRGQIEFLLDFCGAVKARSESEPTLLGFGYPHDVAGAFFALPGPGRKDVLSQRPG